MNPLQFQQQSVALDDFFPDDNTWLISDTHFFHANIGHVVVLMAGKS